MSIFNKHYKKGKTHLENARKQILDGHPNEALDTYRKAIDEFKAEGSSLFHDVKKHLVDAYVERGDVYKGLGEIENATVCYKEALEYDQRCLELSVKLETARQYSLPETTTPTLPFFIQDPLVTSNPRSEIGNILSTQDLSYYLQPNNHTQEQAPELIELALEVIEQYAQRNVKSQEQIYEIIALASIPDIKVYEELLKYSIKSIDSELHQPEYLFCLSQVIQNMPKSLLITRKVSTGNLVSILRILHRRLEELHEKDNEDQLFELLQIICSLLDAMVWLGVKGISHEKLYAPLYRRLKELKVNPALAYHVHYACQALLHIPNDESLLKEVMHRTFKVTIGTMNLVSAFKNLDPNKLLDAFKNFSEAFESFGEIANRIQELVETIQILREEMQGMEFKQTRQWYLALRFMDIFIQENQFVRLEQFIRKSPYRKDKWFLIGLCQRLGQVACIQQDSKIQQGAVKFLGDLYQNQTQWGKNLEVKEWVLIILQQLANQNDEYLKNNAKSMINKVTSSENVHIPSKHVPHIMYSVRKFNVFSEFLIQAHINLRSKRNLVSSFAKPLAQLRKGYESELEQDKEIKDALNLYVPPKGKLIPKEESPLEEKFQKIADITDLETMVDILLASEIKVLLLLGEAGAGKSTFNRHLARRFWDDYSSKNGLLDKHIPLFISLPAIDKLDGEIVQNYLRRMKFTEEIIEILKQSYKFLFILDGYDEIKDRRSNIYDKNQLHEWNAKVIISCRSEYLNINYKQKFIPSQDSNLFAEIWIKPFSKEEIREYISKYVKKKNDVAEKMLWDAQRYEDILERIPNSHQLLSNPFILKIAMQVMPHLDRQSVTRLALYNKFMEKWFERSQVRLCRIQLDEEEEKVFNKLDEINFARHCIQFNKELAVEMFKADEIVIEYSGVGETYWDKFFGYEKRLLRYNSPLSRNGDQFRFIHKSLFEYFVSLTIYEEIYEKASSALFENFLIPRDPGIVRFLTEYTQHNGGLGAQRAKKFRENIRNVIENSKEDSFEIVAINTISILILDELEQDEVIKNSLNSYVPPKGMWSLNTTPFFDLEAEIEIFLASDKKVLLLLGEAGAGKSTFCSHVTLSLWAAYSSKDKLNNKFIPLFISLSTIENPNEGLIQEYFGEMGFSMEVIENLKQRCKFVFILDGYNEIKDRRFNIYDKNNLHEWNAKVIISCRPEYLRANYKSKFIPSGNFNSFQEIWLAPFSKEEIREYIRKYIKKQKDVAQKMQWDTQSYETVLKRIPHLDQLLGNPLIANIAMQVMLDLDREGNKNWAKSVTRLTLYNKLIEKWFERSEERLYHIQLDEEVEDLLKRIDVNDFMRLCMRFSKDLAVKMFMDNEIVVTYSDADDTKTNLDWRALFFKYETKGRFLLYNSPLSRNGDQYRFIHKSLLEYFVTRSIYEAICKEARSTLFEKISILGDPGVVRFLIEYVQQGRSSKDEQQAEIFKSNLFYFIEKSKENINFEIAAANAISILNKAGVSFSGKNLNGIHIAGADLSYGLFHCTQFKEANLINVNFKGAWLQYANFSGANMSGVQFGEFPFLDLEESCEYCCYSPDGRFLAIAGGVKIYLYNVESLEKIHTFEGHTDSVRSATFSPDGTQLVSGSSDNTVRLWSLENLNLNPHILNGHTDIVWSVAFSPDGTQLVSGSSDNTVRLWSLENLDLNPHILYEHTSDVNSVTFSPDGTQVASGSSDNTVRLWSLENLDQNPRILYGHINNVNSVAFSPDGTQLASGSLDNTVRLWSLENLDPNPSVIYGHTNYIRSVTFSPDGTQLASGSSDNTVRLWSLDNLDLTPRIMEGHTDTIWSVTFSPDGTQLATGSLDNTVRLWSLENLDQNSRIIDGHTDTVWSVALSPDGTQLASGSLDNTVRLWSLENLDQNSRILCGHTNNVYSVTFSPDGNQIASGSLDNTVRLWSFENLELNPRIMEGHTDTILSVAFSPDGTQMASGSSDNTVRLWSLENLDPNPRILYEHTNDVNCVTFSPDGTQLASGSSDNTVRLWSLENLGQKPCILYGHTKNVNSVTFSPDGTQLASGSSDNKVRLWSLENLDLTPRIMEGHTDTIWSVTFSPDGKQLASGSSDNTVRLWSMVSGNCVSIIYFPGTIISLDWKNTKVGDLLLTGGEDKVIRLWHVKRIDDQKTQVALHWTSHQNMLWISKAYIQNVKGLDSMNIRLLKQRGGTEDSKANFNENNLA